MAGFLRLREGRKELDMRKRLIGSLGILGALLAASVLFASDSALASDRIGYTEYTGVWASPFQNNSAEATGGIELITWKYDFTGETCATTLKSAAEQGIGVWNDLFVGWTNEVLFYPAGQGTSGADVIVRAETTHDGSTVDHGAATVHGFEQTAHVSAKSGHLCTEYNNGTITFNDLKAVFTHEFGHILGLDDHGTGQLSCATYGGLMNNRIPHGTCSYVPTTDEANAVKAIWVNTPAGTPTNASATSYPGRWVILASFKDYSDTDARFDVRYYRYIGGFSTVLEHTRHIDGNANGKTAGAVVNPGSISAWYQCQYPGYAYLITVQPAAFKGIHGTQSGYSNSMICPN